MKVFVCAILVFALLLTGTVVYVRWLDRTTLYFERKLEHISKTVQRSDWTKSQEEMSAFFKEWNRVYPTFEFFIYHSEIDKINQILYELNGYINTKQQNAFLVKCHVVQKILKQLPVGEQITAENIL